MKIKFKKLNIDAVVPKYAHENGDACVDFVAINDGDFNKESHYWEYETGIAIEIPKGYVGLIFPRSSITNKGLMLKNSVGVIDESYRGSIKFRFTETEFYKSQRNKKSKRYNKGDKIGQLMIIPIPKIEFQEVDELSNTDRGTGGFGSTDK